MFERPDAQAYAMFRTPGGHNQLLLSGEAGLAGPMRELYPFLDRDGRVIDFAPDTSSLPLSYDLPERYQNELDWLWATFRTTEEAARTEILDRVGISRGDRVLITGCGPGAELGLLRERVGPDGVVHAQDISREMVLRAAEVQTAAGAILSVSDALDLPYANRFFDCVIHFGGLNLYRDRRRGIAEMERVCRKGGTVLVVDEGLAMHLRQTEFAEVVFCNNPLWRAEPPLSELPLNAEHITLSYILGQCFYVVRFTVGEGVPDIDFDVEHKGSRGGTMRTRYFGRTEGVTPATLDLLRAEAQGRGVSVFGLLDRIVSDALGKDDHGR